MLPSSIKRVLGTSPARSFQRRGLHRDKSIPFVSHLEVERKFSPTPYLTAHLSGIMSGISQEYPRHLMPLRLSPQPTMRIRDVYFDKDGQLSRSGVWVRRRESTDYVPALKVLSGPSSIIWEAKVRISGDHVNSQMVEVEGKDDVQRIVHEHIPGTGLSDLVVMADLETLRRSWLVHESERRTLASDQSAQDQELKIRIVLDSVTAPGYGSPGIEAFQHEVGEIEMVGDISGGINEAEHASVRLEAGKRMHERLQRFMSTHAALFQLIPKQGKLNAFFAWKSSKSSTRLSGK